MAAAFGPAGDAGGMVTTPSQRTVSVPGGLEVPVFEFEGLEAGRAAFPGENGKRHPTAVYLHGVWDQPPNEFVNRLAETMRVVAPVHPGFEGAPPADRFVDIQDSVTYHLDLLDALGIEGAILVGHSLGAMIAAELAAVQPQRFSRLVLIAPLCLWDDAHPVADFFAMQPQELSAALYHDVTSPSAVAVATAPRDEDALVEYLLRRSRAMATATRYLWPLPDRGLRRRVHRIAAPTLVLWGAKDGIAPSWYGEELCRLIADARLAVVPEAAHLVHLERADAVLPLVREFCLDVTEDGSR